MFIFDMFRARGMLPKLSMYSDEKIVYWEGGNDECKEIMKKE